MRIEQLELQTSDFAAQRDFYANVLRLPTTGAGGALSVQAGSTRIVFTHSSGQGEQVYHLAFNVPENRFEEARAWIARRATLLKNNAGEDSFNFENWIAHSCYFRDPSGNILEFIARHTVSNGSDRPFDEAGILSVSEVGVVTDDVHETVELLTHAGINTYDGVGSDTFSAVGDEHGLFIVVKQGRIWFPDTGIPADLLPLKAIVSTEVGARLIFSGPPYQLSYR